MSESTTVTLGRFMAYDVGCIECGESSGVLGFYPTAAEAEEAVRVAEERQEDSWSGEHSMFVVDLADPTISGFSAK